MPKPVKKRKRTPPRDINQWARQLVDESTAEPATETREPQPKPRISKELRAYMAKLGKRGGQVSGARRMKNLTDEQRQRIALHAAQTRWAKRRKKA